MPDFVRAWHLVNQQRNNGEVDQPNTAPLANQSPILFNSQSLEPAKSINGDAAGMY